MNITSARFEKVCESIRNHQSFKPFA